MPADDRATQAALDALIGKISAAGAASVRTGALVIQAAGMRHSPVLTGTLRRSWRTQTINSGVGVYAARVGPTVVYARRIELGFKGEDSLGRVYDQQPKPYAKPGYEEAFPAARAAILRGLAAALR